MRVYDHLLNFLVQQQLHSHNNILQMFGVSTTSLSSFYVAVACLV